MRYVVCIVVSLFLCLQGSVCMSYVIMHTDEEIQAMYTAAAETVLLEPKEFTEVILTWGTGKFFVTPKPTAHLEIEVLINMPKRAIVRTYEEGDTTLRIPLPIVAYYHLRTPDLEQRNTPDIVVINKLTQKLYTGKPVHYNRSGFADQSQKPLNFHWESGGARTFNLTEHVTLPLTSATYEVWIKMGEQLSNKCTVEIIVTIP